MNFKNWVLEDGDLDEEELTLHYCGELNGKKYDGYIVNLDDFEGLNEDTIEEYKDEILTKKINQIINKPRFDELPDVLQDMYINHGHSQVFMIYYEKDSYEEDMRRFAYKGIDEANAFMNKHFDNDCYEEFIYPEKVEERMDTVVTMYGSIWEQVDFTECEGIYK